MRPTAPAAATSSVQTPPATRTARARTVLFRLAAAVAVAATLGMPDSSAAEAASAVLYDPTAGTLPSNQGWAYLTEPLFLAKTRQSHSDGAAVLDSTAIVGEKAGWFSNLPPLPKHPRQPTLDSAAGFVFSFVVRVAAESHTRPERAGFSVIATAADLSAIELAFWTNEIWAQSGPDFLHAEGAPFDTTTGRIRYDLVIHDGRYRLSAGGRQVLEGPLRRYDSFGTPYQIREFLFLGDDTTSAAARVELGRVVVSPLPRVQLATEGGQVRLSAEAESGRTVAFEASPDLATWTEVGTAVSAEGTARLEVAPDAPRRFFRAALR